jgi:hypothetical protein
MWSCSSTSTGSSYERHKARRTFPTLATRNSGRELSFELISQGRSFTVLPSSLTASAATPRRTAPALLTAGRGSTRPSQRAELLSQRGLERPCETLVAWARKA